MITPYADFMGRRVADKKTKLVGVVWAITFDVYGNVMASVALNKMPAGSLRPFEGGVRFPIDQIEIINPDPVITILNDLPDEL